MTNPVQIPDAAQQMLNTWDQFINGEPCSDMVKADVDLLIKAACFAAQAYEDMIASPITADAAPGTLLRIFLTAIVDPSSKELDPYRAKNRPDATLTNEGTKPVDVAAVREQCAQIAESYDETDTLTAPKEIAAAIRTLSAEPAQGEQWQPIELVGDKERLITIGSYNAKGVWCAEVWHTKYLRDQQAKSADGFFMNAPHLEWVPTHFMELPAAPTTEAEA